MRLLFNGTSTQEGQFVPTAGEGNWLSRLKSFHHKTEQPFQMVSSQSFENVCAKFGTLLLNQTHGKTVSSNTHSSDKWQRFFIKCSIAIDD